MNEKDCTKCRNSFPATLEFFYKQSGKRDGLTSRCKGCHNQSVTSWIKKNRKKRVRYMRTARLRLKYGISDADYERMFNQQDGKCALCGNGETKQVGGVTCRLAVDHNHVTGKVRALLCGMCNKAIGALKDDPALMRRAADYVESYAV